MHLVHQTHFVFLPFLWVDYPYFTRLRSGFGIWDCERSLFYRKGSHRKGGSNSHGKGSHYEGGHFTEQVSRSTATNMTSYPQ
jgi:hypothetical protein